MELEYTVLYTTVVSYLLSLTDPAHRGITGIHSQALREIEKVCQTEWAMSSAAWAHYSTHVEPTSISLGLIYLSQHHIHFLGLDLGAGGLATHVKARGLVGSLGPARTLQFTFPQTG